MRSLVTATSGNMSALLPVAYVSGNATALINSVTALSPSLTSIRAVLVQLNGDINNITDLAHVKVLLRQVVVRGWW